MRARDTWKAVVLGCLLGGSGCSESPVVGPEPPAPEVLEFHYSARFVNSDGGCVVRHVEYADASGSVREVTNPLPGWFQTLSLKRGDRIYMRAEVDFDAAFWSALQVRGPETFYRIAECLRVDGPGTCVLKIDELVE